MTKRVGMQRVGRSNTNMIDHEHMKVYTHQTGKDADR
jgi:hypothetical protein